MFVLRGFVERVEELVALGYGYLQSLIRFLARLAFSDEPSTVPVRHNASILAAVPFHHERRLDRALYHLESLETEVTAWLEKSPYRTWTERDVDSSRKVGWIEVLERPPAQFGLIIGDCLHNLRSALDNLAFELAIAHKGEPPPPKIVGASAFPIFAQKNPDKLDDMLGGIHPAAKTKIEGLQPYNRGKKFRTDPLWKLNKLCTMDKHRLPHVALMLVAPILIAPGGPVPDEMEGVTCAVEDRAPIAFYSAFDHAGAEVNVHLAPALDIAFGQSVPQEVRGMAVPYTLAHIHKYIIEKTLPPLLPFLS